MVPLDRVCKRLVGGFLILWSVGLVTTVPFAHGEEIAAAIPAGDSMYRELRWADNLGLLAAPLMGARPVPRDQAFRLLLPLHTGKTTVPSSAMGTRIEAMRLELMPWEVYWEQGVYPVTVGGNVLECLALHYSDVAGGEIAPVPNDSGELAEDGVRLQGDGALFWEGDWFAFNLGYRLYVSEYEDVSLRLVGLNVRTGWRNLRLTYGQEALWWSPSDHSALLLSTNARPMKQLRLETNAPWRTALGRFHLSTFVGHLDDPDRSGFGDPWVTGMRGVWSPVRWFTFGGTRTFMLGGHGNPYVITWDSVLDLFLGRNENRKDVEDVANDTNQLASVDASLYLWPLFQHLPFLEGGRIYAERGGEDSPQGKHFNTVLPSAPGLTLGAEIIAGGVLLRVETSDNVDDSNIWYYHRRYTDGYTYRNRVLGHPMGGDAQAVSLGVEAPLRGGRDVLILEWNQWDRGHESPRHLQPESDQEELLQGIQDWFTARYEYGVGDYPGHLALEVRHRRWRGDRELFGSEEEWGVSLAWRR